MTAGHRGDVLEPAWRIPEGQGRELGMGIVGCDGIVSYGHMSAHRGAGLRVVAVIDVDADRARAVAHAFVGPMGDLMDAIATGREPITSGRDNLGTPAVVMAAYRSATERRSVRWDEIVGEPP